MHVMIQFSSVSRFGCFTHAQPKTIWWEWAEKEWIISGKRNMIMFYSSVSKVFNTVSVANSLSYTFTDSLILLCSISQHIVSRNLRSLKITISQTTNNLHGNVINLEYVRWRFIYSYLFVSRKEWSLDDPRWKPRPFPNKLASPG